MLMNITTSRPSTWFMRNRYSNEHISFYPSISYRKSSDSLQDIIPSYHWHDFIQVWYTISGTYKQHFRNMDLELPAGSLVVVPPFAPHRTYGDKGIPVNVACLDFPIDFLSDILPQRDLHRAFLFPFLNTATGLPHIVFTGSDKEYVDKLFFDINSLYAENAHKCMVLHRNKVYELIHFIANSIQLATQGNYTLREQRNINLIIKAINYIEQHYNRPVKLHTICNHTTLARTNFCSLFKQYTGNTFQEHLSYLRICHALAELTHTDKPISTIMTEAGFSTKSNFNKQFRDITGMTPREFRTLIHEYNAHIEER